MDRMEDFSMKISFLFLAMFFGNGKESSSKTSSSSSPPPNLLWRGKFHCTRRGLLHQYSENVPDTVKMYRQAQI